MKIDGLDCVQDANVTGKIDALNTYRVQFKDEAAAQSSARLPREQFRRPLRGIQFFDGTTGSRRRQSAMRRRNST